MMTKAKIQALVDRGLLRSKTEVEWRAATGEDFPSEDVKEQVIFTSFLECSFNLPAGDFFRGLLYYYRLELVRLVPNSITVVSTLRCGGSFSVSRVLARGRGQWGL
jgi:hypothetical protein